jgi:hypothetical protein
MGNYRGIGCGLVYRARGTSGSSDVLARIINKWRGVSVAKLSHCGYGCDFSWDFSVEAGIVRWSVIRQRTFLRRCWKAARLSARRYYHGQRKYLSGDRELERGVTYLGRGAYGN